MQMSRSPEPSFPIQTLERLGRADQPARIAVLGIGHELRGDDAAGIAVARGLASLVNLRQRLLVIDVGPAPENFTGTVRRFKPDLVLLVDAAQLNEAPGSLRWIDWQDTVGLTASTHTLPLHVLSRYLAGELGCKVALLGIQPAHTAFGAPLSPGVRRAVDSVVRKLADMLL
jgi:hydrogenase 3 maturation protease